MVLVSTMATMLQRATSARAACRVVSGAARLRAQCYSTSLADVELAAPHPAPLCALLEEEQAMAEAAARFARERVGPVVQSMDEACRWAQQAGHRRPGILRAQTPVRRRARWRPT